jgi:hypothetical protein
MRKSIGEFVLVCLVLQMVIFVLLDQRFPDARTGAPPSPHRYVQRSLAESTAISWDENDTLTHEHFLEADLRPVRGLPGNGDLQNVSLPLTEPWDPAAGNGGLR